MTTEAAAGQRPAQLAETIELLFGAGGEAAYSALKEKREAVLATRSSAESANAFILRAWALAPAVDWAIWHEALAQTDTPSADASEAANQLLPRLFAVWPVLDEDQIEGFPDVIRSVVPRAGRIDDDGIHAVVEALEAVLDPADWATDGDARERRQYLHAGARELRALGSEIWQRVEANLTNDIIAGLKYVQTPRPTKAVSVFEAVRGMETMGQHLGLGRIADLMKQLPEFDADVQPDEASAEVSARACLTAAAREQGGEWTNLPFGVSASKVRAVAHSKGRDLDDAIAHWLALDPRARHVAPVAELLLPDLPPASETALAQWAAEATRPQRTSLAKGLLQSSNDSTSWLQVLSKQPLDEAGLVDILRERVVDGESVAVRATAAREARALRLRTQGAGRALAGAVGQLLRKGRARGDIDVAAMLIAAVPAAHVKRDSWGRSLKNRCKERDHRLSQEAIRALRAAEISIPKDGVRKSVWKRIFG